MEVISKSVKDQAQIELDQLSEERINFKLSLRKKKYNDILAKKRIMASNPEDSPWTLDLYLSKLNLPSNYKRIFAKDEELVSTALKSIKSELILDVKYGICLFKIYILYFLNDENLQFNLNLNFASDLLNLLEKWGDKKEKQIIFNLLYLLTNYSYLNKNKMISKILLSSKGYKIWDLCFDLQDYEIMSQLVWILNNIIYEDNESSYNLLKSNFFQKKIFNFYSNPTIISHLNENDTKNIFYMIIERGITLFTNLLTANCPSTYDTEIKLKLSIPVFSLVTKYSESNSSKIYHSCVYSISSALNNESRFNDLLDNSNILNDIVNKKFFSNEKIVLHSNRIIGEYIANKSKLPEDFYIKCTNYQMDVFFGAKSSININEVYWVLSNVIHDSERSAEIVCNNDLFIDKILLNYKNAIKYEEIRDISYLFNILVKQVDVNNFIKLINKGLVDITLQIAKITFDEPKRVTGVFELIEAYLDIENMVQKTFGKNIFIKEKCDNYGFIDLLKKYENSNDENLEIVIERIIKNHYS